MKLKTLAVLFVLVMALSMAVGVFAQDFTETWDENTVLTVFNDLDMYFPDMFADEDSDFLWVDNGPADFPSEFPKTEGKSADVIAKAPLAVENEATTMDASFDPCGDGLIKYDVTVTKMVEGDTGYDSYYYAGEKTSYIRDINAYLTVKEPGGSSSSYKLGVKTCESTGGDGCKSITFKKTSDGKYQGHLKGYLTVPVSIIMYAPEEGGWNYDLDMFVDFSTYMTALWPVENNDLKPYDFGTVYASASTTGDDPTLKANMKRDYCQESLKLHNPFNYELVEDMDDPVRAVYDENTGEARLQVVIRNIHPDVRKQNYVIPAEVFAFTGVDDKGTDTFIVWEKTPVDKNYTILENSQRITDYTCRYTVFNVANAAPRTDYCKFGEGIAIPDHGMVRIDITIDSLSGNILREAGGDPVFLTLRLGGYMGKTVEIEAESSSDTAAVPETFTGYIPSIRGVFKAVDFPCPKVSRMQVLDPLKPFMSFYKVLKSDGAIKPSGAYGVYEGGLWGMYQKCGKSAYMMVRLKNDGLDDEIVNLDHTAAAVNGGTPMKWNWVMTTVEPEKGSKIVLEPGKEVILIGRAKVTDIPSQLNADTAMTGAVNFTDFGFYITGKVYSDHNNTRCVAAPK